MYIPLGIYTRDIDNYTIGWCYMHFLLRGIFAWQRYLVSSEYISISYDTDVALQTDVEGSVEIEEVLHSPIVDIHQRPLRERERDVGYTSVYVVCGLTEALPVPE